MAPLVHLIYYSRATQAFDDKALAELLSAARENNERLDVTGMLLYACGSFFQVLEGDPDTVQRLFDGIAGDPRHAAVTTIICEPIAQRSFSEWTMGHAGMSAEEVGYLVGGNDFFTEASCFENLNPGRAQKLLAAFKDGRWRARLSGAAKASTLHTAVPRLPRYTFAFQPVVNARLQTVVAYEALIRGLAEEPAWQVLQQVTAEESHRFDAASRDVAMALAMRLNLPCGIHLNLLPLSVDKSLRAIDSTLEAAARIGLAANRITLELDHDERIVDLPGFAALVRSVRGSGVRVAIDNFGAGHSGLNLLDQFQPDGIALNMNLIRGIESNGPRQAILGGIRQTCKDLGVELIAKGVETRAEYDWLMLEGIELYQGYLFAAAGFEQLPTVSFSGISNAE